MHPSLRIPQVWGGCRRTTKLSPPQQPPSISDLPCLILSFISATLPPPHSPLSVVFSASFCLASIFLRLFFPLIISLCFWPPGWLWSRPGLVVFFGGAFLSAVFPSFLFSLCPFSLFLISKKLGLPRFSIICYPRPQQVELDKSWTLKKKTNRSNKKTPFTLRGLACSSDREWKGRAVSLPHESLLAEEERQWQWSSVSSSFFSGLGSALPAIVPSSARKKSLGYQCILTAAWGSSDNGLERGWVKWWSEIMANFFLDTPMEVERTHCGVYFVLLHLFCRHCFALRTWRW